ncbi:co-chaperone GroES [Bdellovibrio bacteriovorus]|nr:co-chaperone GroES [Bdellovibrio bacteriovorus]
MAKKKASAKKSNVKKVAKKTVSKKPVTKSTKKVSAKSKKAAKAPAKKTAAKKTITKSKAKAKTPVKKAAPAKGKSSAPTVATSKSEKIVDLSNFVTPLDDRLIIQTAGAEKMTAGGLYIPDTVADVSGNLQGHVVAVGRGHLGKKGHVRPMDVKVGDKIVFSEFAGTKITIQNQNLIILREGDVLGVVSK